MIVPGEEAANPRADLMRRSHWIILIAVIAASGIIGFNAAVSVPVAMRLSEDVRNKGVGLVAYRSWGVSPTALTIDLRDVDARKAPVDLFRALFQTADTLKGSSFTTVTLARRGKPVFVMNGRDFMAIGASFSADENPIYLIRTLPEKLARPDGKPAYQHWDGGFLVVLLQQMGDVNAFARDWIAG